MQGAAGSTARNVPRKPLNIQNSSHSRFPHKTRLLPQDFSINRDPPIGQIDHVSAEIDHKPSILGVDPSDIANCDCRARPVVAAHQSPANTDPLRKIIL